MAKQPTKDELMAEFFRMLMADAQQAQKQSASNEEYTMDSFPRYREADHVLKYTVRVALRGIRPPIWRRVIVPSNISLRLFGDLILELMGWMGEHLNQFRKGDSYFAPAYQREGELPPLFGRIRNYNQEDFSLGEIGSPAIFRVPLPKDPAQPEHEERQIGHPSQLSPEAFHLGVE